MRSFVAIVVGLVAASALYWYQNPDLELKIPEGLITQLEEQRSALRQVPDSFAEIVATRTPKPSRIADIEIVAAPTPKLLRRTVSEAGVQEDSNLDRNADPFDRASDLEQKVHAGINAARAQNSVSPQLRWVDKLGAVARVHSEDMTARNYFSHDSPEGLGPSERIERVGYSCRKESHYGVAENITIVLVGDSLDHMASDAVRSWMTSPGHRTNLLGEDYDRTGIGASFGRWRGYDAVYVTQVFC